MRWDVGAPKSFYLTEQLQNSVPGSVGPGLWTPALISRVLLSIQTGQCAHYYMYSVLG